MRRRILLAALLLLTGSMIWQISATANAQTQQQAAKRWQGTTDQPYCYGSVFWNSGELTAAEAATLAASLEQTIPSGAERAPILTAYGGTEAGRAVYANRSVEAELWYVSEDFFLLHPYAMIEGGVHQLSMPLAVLNEAAAWQLFGSVYGCGETIMIDGAGYRVAAILQEPRDAAAAVAYGSTPRIFLPLTERTEITFFEAVLPEYYAGYAAQTLSDLTGRPVMENTRRFCLPRLWEQAKRFLLAPPEAVPQLPPWEQAAILTQRRLCVLWLLLFPAAALLLYFLGKEVWQFGKRRCFSAPPAKKRSRRIGGRYFAVHALCADRADESAGAGGDG